ncbi:hypothetical protein CSOJ01_03186 [Colletotrichum sojae]|uniref:Uncharacterized protein n=1 Tax=Colletotrichum sojae TaxID=2175907 RepID=A0A8H6N1I7_9PEZI|nr:hypothetical protein CSOJ01_03186 [Colletotrichum sojae]
MASGNTTTLTERLTQFLRISKGESPKITSRPGPSLSNDDPQGSSLTISSTAPPPKESEKTDGESSTADFAPTVQGSHGVQCLHLPPELDGGNASLSSTISCGRTKASSAPGLRQGEKTTDSFTEGKPPIFTREIDHPEVRRYRDTEIYVTDIPIPSNTRSAYDEFIEKFRCNFNEVERQMFADQCRHRRLRKQGRQLTKFMLEFRISGRPNRRASRSVDLSPCLWILCGSEWCQKRISDVAKALEVPVTLSTQPIEVHYPLPILCSRKVTIPLSRLPYDAVQHTGVAHMGGTILYHIEDRALLPEESICGMLCCATFLRNGVIVEQQISRIGGILSSFLIRGEEEMPTISPIVMTTSHGIFDHVWLENALRDTRGGDETETDSASSDSEPEDAPMAPDQGLLLGARVLSDTLSWTPLEDLVGLNYLGATLSNLRPPGTASIPADYALLSSASLNDNEKTRSQFQVADITNFVPNEQLTEGPVSLIIGHDEISEASLIPGYVRLPVETAELKVRKIKIAAPLGNYSSSHFSQHFYLGCLFPSQQQGCRERGSVKGRGFAVCLSRHTPRSHWPYS